MKKYKFFLLFYLTIYFLTGIVTSNWSFFNIFGLLLNIYANFFYGVQFFLKMFTPPNLAYLGEVWKPLLESLTMAYISVFIAIPFAVVISLLASQRVNKNKVTLNLTRLLISVDRSLPTYVKASIFVAIIGVGIWSGILALTLYAIFFAARQITNIIDSADMTAYNYGLKITNKFSATILFLYDQVLFQALSTIIYTFEINLKSSVIIGIVGAGGIGSLIQFNIDWRQFANVGAILLVVFAIIALIEFFLSKLREVIAYE